MKRFEYSLLGKEIKAQSDITKKQYQKFDNNFEFDKTIEKEKPTIEKYNRSNLIYSSKFSFYEYYDTNFNSISLKSKFKIFTFFYNELIKFYRLIPKIESAKEEKAIVFDDASEMYNEYLKTFSDQYMASWVISMMLLIYFLLMHILMITGLKIKNRLIRQEKVIKKNLRCHLQKVMKKK